MLCTSGFMDDVTFGRSGPYGDAWKASGVAIPTEAESDVYECLVLVCVAYLHERRFASCRGWEER